MTTFLWGDFETYFAKDYTLSKVTPAEYILDARFEALGCAFIEDDGPSFWIDGPDLPAFFAEFDWTDTVFISHNALFDACIMAWRYHVKPLMWGDTLAMARAVAYHKTGSVSLKALAEHYGLPPKWDTTNRFKGYGLAQVRQYPELYGELVLYGCDDVEKCKFLWKQLLADGFPPEQLEVVDMQIRMATQPKLVADQQLLWNHLTAVMTRKEELIARCGEDVTTLASSDKFAALLESYGVEPPMKISKTTGKETFAFAKTDRAFTDLEDHEDPDVQALVAARLGVKSTLEESRTKRFIAISNLTWLNGERPGSVPIPLRYSGAHTHRFSGDWSVNAQNLPRAPNDALRRALQAPPGHKVVSVDLSQIEARMTATFARQMDLYYEFQRGEDVYASFASLIYGKAINKEDHPIERQLGKVAILSLGYGASWRTFQGMVRSQSNRTIFLDDDECERIVKLYRATYNNITRLWRQCDNLIFEIANGGTLQYGPVRVENHSVVLPSEHRLRYNDLRQVRNEETGRWSWTYLYGKQTKYLYGAKLVENFVQSLAFCLIMEAAVRIKRKTQGLLQLVHQVHDELVYVVPESIAEEVAAFLKTEVIVPPAWLLEFPLDLPLQAKSAVSTHEGGPKIILPKDDTRNPIPPEKHPLAAEASIGDSYGDC